VRGLQTATLGLAAALNLASSRTQSLFFERVLFCPAAARQRLLHGLLARRCSLDRSNARDVALASGTVPLYMAAVRDIAGAPPGSYIDGGLSDYHLNLPLDTGGEGVVLMFLHQQRIVPNWFDRYAPWRRPARAHLRDLLLIYPDPEFVARLPGGRVPTREDFRQLVDQPDMRIARWRSAAAESDRLGERFLEDLARGRLASKLRALA
jgi:hypothetical protein